MVRIESSLLVVDVLPEVGGKISQIRCKATGHDLLVPPQRPYRTIPPDGDWLKHDTSGMDDCFPNVAAGAYPEPPWAPVWLPDLGEWTHTAWKFTKVEGKEVAMQAEGHALPYSAVKSVRFVDEQTLEFSYCVENHGPTSIRYLWSAHPLIAVEGPFRIELPHGNLKFQVFPPREEGAHPWPLFDGADLSHQWVEDGTTLKIFVTGLTAGSCSLHLPEHTLRFTFDLHDLPAVGIWFNNFGFPREGGAPFRCIAIEPCTSPSDLLDGLEATAYPRISPGASVQWSMRLTVAACKSSQT